MSNEPRFGDGYDLGSDLPVEKKNYVDHDAMQHYFVPKVDLVMDSQVIAVDFDLFGLEEAFYFAVCSKFKFRYE